MAKNNRIAEIDKLFYEVGVYRNSEDYRSMINFIKKFPHIAPYNAMLVYTQKPGSRFVASAYDWKRRYNRTIMQGARPLVILRPFGPVAFVYELMDTEGKDPFPKELLEPFRPVGTVSRNMADRLMQNMLCEGISVTPQDYGSWQAGYATLGDKETVFNRNEQDRYLIKVFFEIVFNENHSIETSFTTFLHELGHIYCGHLPNPKAKWIVNRYDYSALTENVIEFEAESVCWLVCERLGIKNPSAEYLSGYLAEKKYIPDISIDTVLKAVGIIESLIREHKRPRKEVLVEKLEH